MRTEKWFAVVLLWVAVMVGTMGSVVCEEAGRAAALRVMTYNIHHGEGCDHKVDLDRLAAIIQAERPDVVCLQEVDRHLPRTQNLDFPALLAEKLKMPAVFDPNYKFDGGEYGNATFTRLEVVSHENIHLPGPDGAEPRGCLRTTLRVGGQTIDVLNTHLGLDVAERNDQAAAILREVRAVPTILAGDFNESSKDPAVAQLLSRFSECAPDADTTAKTLPWKKRIDYVLVSKAVGVISSRVVATPESAVASDHLPWVAEVRVRSADAGVYDTNDERVREAIVEGT